MALTFRPLVLTNEKIESLWVDFSKFWQVFDDVMPKTFEVFKQTLLQPYNAFYELLDGEKVVGLASGMGIRPTVDAVIHLALFDRRLRGREFVLLLCLGDFMVKYKLRRVTAFLADDNPMAQKLARRIGFVHEGTMRAGMKRRGQFHDLQMYGMLIEELYASLKAHAEGPASVAPRAKPDANGQYSLSLGDVAGQPERV
jgi:RimJ/RimL family protein N-acetyltransferase